MNDDRLPLEQTLRRRLSEALQSLDGENESFASMVRPTADPTHGDYQINAAMPLGKRLGRPPREVAVEIVDHLNVGDIFEAPDVAGPGFINLKIRDAYLTSAVDDRLRHRDAILPPIGKGEKVVIDFSSPNVAKPMHVGHIRSTVIGDCLSRTMRAAGYEVVTDNHLGDWGTQFGIIIYGYKHFGDAEQVAADPVVELSKLYRLTQQLIEYHAAGKKIPALQAEVEALTGELFAEEGSAPTDPKAAKKWKKARTAKQRKIDSLRGEIDGLQEKRRAVELDPQLASLANEHPRIGEAVLRETAALHRGDETNRELWHQFLPACRKEIERIYDRLNVEFDHTLGESFYHDRLPGVIDRLKDAGRLTDSDGAKCVFIEGFDAPMIVQKSDGAFLYATTDLATLVYRQEEFDPDEILYVVDSRQGEHFEKLFAAAPLMGLEGVRLVHVNFGTVLGPDGRPMKTRSGSLVNLESLLDAAVERAMGVVCDPERIAAFDPPMGGDEQRSIAEAVGIGAVKFNDLSHHRTSDYRFDIEKMVSLDGGTATYIQYQYSRTQSLLAKAGVDVAEYRNRMDSNGGGVATADTKPADVSFGDPAERELAIALIRFGDAVSATIADKAPNHLADYLTDTAKRYARFNDRCPVIRAADDSARQSRLRLVVLTADILRTGLDLLGIRTVPRM